MKLTCRTFLAASAAVAATVRSRPADSALNPKPSALNSPRVTDDALEQAAAQSAKYDRQFFQSRNPLKFAIHQSDFASFPNRNSQLDISPISATRSLCPQARAWASPNRRKCSKARGLSKQAYCEQLARLLPRYHVDQNHLIHPLYPPRQLDLGPHLRHDLDRPQIRDADEGDRGGWGGACGGEDLMS